MKDITIKYNQLDKGSQKQVDNLLDFLLNKKNTGGMSAFLKEYKKRILGISAWSEDDLKPFKSNTTKFNKLKIEEW